MGRFRVYGRLSGPVRAPRARAEVVSRFAFRTGPSLYLSARLFVRSLHPIGDSSRSGSRGRLREDRGVYTAGFIDTVSRDTVLPGK